MATVAVGSAGARDGLINGLGWVPFDRGRWHHPHWFQELADLQIRSLEPTSCCSPCLEGNCSSGSDSPLPPANEGPVKQRRDGGHGSTGGSSGVERKGALRRSALDEQAGDRPARQYACKVRPSHTPPQCVCACTTRATQRAVKAPHTPYPRAFITTFIALTPPNKAPRSVVSVAATS